MIGCSETPRLSTKLHKPFQFWGIDQTQFWSLMRTGSTNCIEKMGWGHPDITLEETLRLIKGFVDILILASGYQSSGLLAHWDALNIKKAFQWGIFFEHVFSRFSSSVVYQDSMKELDATLSEMTSNPSFPQGLAYLSIANLSGAKNFVLERLLHTLPLRDAHLTDFLTATIQMDLDLLLDEHHDSLNVYLNKLTLHNKSIDLFSDRMKGSIYSSLAVSPSMKTEKCTGGDFTKHAVKELLMRQSAVSCISSLETGLDILSNSIRCSHWTGSDHCFLREQLNHVKAVGLSRNARCPWAIDKAWHLTVRDEADLECSRSRSRHVELFSQLLKWNHWKSRNLSYLLDKKTVRLVSGADMIFSAPKIQWILVIERLTTSSGCNDNLLETIELLLLGCIARKWSCVVEHIMSVSYDSLTISKQYQEVCNLVLYRSQSFHYNEDMMNSKEKDILDYLNGLLHSQADLLWKLSPALVAVAIPSWSPLFRLYLNEIDTQSKRVSDAIRCCSCTQYEEEHKDCDLAQRIWCLYIFHVCGSHLMHGSSGA